LGQTDSVAVLGSGQQEHLVLLALFAGAIGEQHFDDLADQAVGGRAGGADGGLLLGEVDEILSVPNAGTWGWIALLA